MKMYSSKMALLRALASAKCTAEIRALSEHQAHIQYSNTKFSMQPNVALIPKVVGLSWAPLKSWCLQTLRPVLALQIYLDGTQ